MNWKSTSQVIKAFKSQNQGRCVETLEAIPMDVNPQNIIAIDSNYSYPEILEDYKMKKLKESVESNGWTNENIGSFSLLMFPNGDLVASGGGNHRAVLSKELSISSVRAMVSKVVYCD